VSFVLLILPNPCIANPVPLYQSETATPVKVCEVLSVKLTVTVTVEAPLPLVASIYNLNAAIGVEKVIVPESFWLASFRSCLHCNWLIYR
jgi:hypothetical protein